MEELSTDVLVIGSGLAGVLSAIEADREGLQVLITGKFTIGMGTNTSLAYGAFTTSNSLFSKEDHLQATLTSGRGLNCPSLARTLVEGGPEAIEVLKKYGVPMAERKVGYAVNRPEEPSRLPGVILIKALRERMAFSSIKTAPGLVIFELIIEEGKVEGAFGFLKDGRPCLVKSRAVVLAAGGAGAIYRRNDSQKSILGDGFTLPFRAGLPLFDLEFVQFFPFALAEPRLSTVLLIPPASDAVRLFNEKGEDLLEKLGIGKDFDQAVARERDRFSIALYEASQDGDVYFDLTRISEEEWGHFPLNFLRKSKFPFLERPFLVSPAAHFFMGGTEIDERGETALPGLFAAGEAVWGIHGANRHGGNALTECAVFGRMTGRSAAEYVRRIRDNSGPSNLTAEALRRKWEKKAKSYVKKGKVSSEAPRDIFRSLKDLAWKYAGPVREGDSLKEGLDRLGSLEKRIERVYPERTKDLFTKRDLENGALVLKAILMGSLLRTESRGSFFRKDFPDQNDQVWLKNTCYNLEREEIKISHRPIKP